ncbi:oxidation resistance protein 1 isoform X2 [Diabrotica virgifera virgifera]|uniref:Oxidation resistance protein 1 n=1 Tax=Diabrotica virgifera virgifera TaxID=50390 RepID=A0ABM5KYU3_DIAVI|nr:oxidation resistance protein 1 isoform X2 [Diabrotica virgifera virgifera]
MMSQEVLQVVHEKDPWVEETTISLREHDNSWPNIDEDVPSILDKKGRRKSWHAIKFERKRRKGVIDGSPDGSPVEIRQKRPSWWNIFTNQPWPRSKSRSVDHGITSPFDLDALRAKVDSQFDRSLDRDLDGSTNSLSEKRKAGPPENTTVYTVADRDTLTSVAARFDTTPSELTKLNRLATPYIFPGQQLYVPNREQAENDSEGSTPVEDSHDDLPPAEKELLENLRPVSPKPGHVERVRTPSCPQGGSSSEYEDSESAVFRERFLKINVRHITDGQGVVSGVLLVTPNAVMFDPNVIDPLVIEHGPEAYGVIAPMEFVVNAAIYNDIAHMRVGHCESNLSEKQEIYYPKSEKEEEQDSLMVKDETFPELVTGDDAESVCSCTEREGDAFPKAFERELVTPTNLEDPEGQHKSLEERRKSLLDHHWAIPSRDRQSIDTDEMPAITPTGAPDDHIQDEDDSLNKESCHDSGIDIRESSIPPIVHVPPKKKYSDADIVLSKDWVPPITIGATNLSYTSEPTDSPARKKTNSVSFSLDSSSELDPGQPPLSTSYSESKEDVDKADSRKNKMLKRLSYPLSWVETTLSGDKDEDKPPSQPHSAADVQHSSVFSKVFSSSPIHLVDFGTGLFHKTPSEDSGSGGSAGPHSGGSGSGGPLTGDSTSSSFFPTNIISSVGAMGAQVGASVGAMGAQVGASVGAMGAQVGASVGAMGATVGAMGAQVGASVGAVGRSSVGTFMRQPTESSSKSKTPAPKLDYRSMVSVEDMPELFVSFDKLIPRPARSCDDPPLYLRLRMGKPLNKVIPRSTPLMSYGKKKMRPEYWFSVPKNRIDELYKFIQGWVPHLYGELDEEKVKERGFSLVEMDTELWSEEPTPSASRHGSQDGEITELTKESWEVLPMSEELRRAFYSSSAAPSLDIELTPPDLIGTTEILKDHHREHLCRHLPARAEGYAWTLIFSTSQHGFSLNSMYRKMFKLESPILMVIEDTDNNVFGALTSCALSVSDHFYGTGESLLFSFTPDFKVFNWTGENLYFIKGNNESISIGAGDGKFGLWLDGDLYIGRSESCQTYGNDPLTPKIDFVVKTLECWAFISS